ncbi:helix-turn-helix domain-containing protein [Paenibacillus elgii]|uniref:helix-turn-helix domain-containing protein n=1 Tax=Paenibacillus elgii TaxID=189691 RepID=UPI00203D0CCE|nr:helix-turn-helix domain-containing protein [Paenibacillus elgii]MCM3271131.1 helix-turn-helix domain-containing protein [Paenibacillus elgii]
MDNNLDSIMDKLMDQIMTTEEASELWGLNQDHIKRLCSSGKIVARKRGKTWLLLKDQPNPSQKN